MNWSQLFTSSIGKKIVMGVTGVFLVSFLVVHMGVNAILHSNLYQPNQNENWIAERAHTFNFKTVRCHQAEITVGEIVQSIR